MKGELGGKSINFWAVFGIIYSVMLIVGGKFEFGGSDSIIIEFVAVTLFVSRHGVSNECLILLICFAYILFTFILYSSPSN
jgi:hypothetical protein